MPVFARRSPRRLTSRRRSSPTRRAATLAFEAGLETTRREPADASSPEHGVVLGFGWRLAGAATGRFDMRIELARREAANDNAEDTVGLRLAARW